MIEGIPLEQYYIAIISRGEYSYGGYVNGIEPVAALEKAKAAKKYFDEQQKTKIQ